MSNLLIYNWICYSLDKIPCCYFEVRIKYNNGVQYNKKDVSSDKKKLQTTNELKFYFYPQSSWHVTPKLSSTEYLYYLDEMGIYEVQLLFSNQMHLSTSNASFFTKMH